MDLTLSADIRHVLVLGAGASVDYGLPVWKDLARFIQEKIDSDLENRYQYKNEIMAWLNEIGRDRKYSTIDECIEQESSSQEYFDNGHEIENQIFLLIKDIFQDKYIKNNNGWIKALNEKILLHNDGNLADQIAFINYNYDGVLNDNLLDFSYLPQKKRLLNHREKINALSDVQISTLYPHGNLFKEKNSKYIQKLIKTMKTGHGSLLDAVSCYESHNHVVKGAYSDSKFNIYILGLGGGLAINLNRIKIRNPIFKIHITIKNAEKKDEIISFLSKKYQKPVEEIQVYSTCDELIEKCF